MASRAVLVLLLLLGVAAWSEAAAARRQGVLSCLTPCTRELRVGHSLTCYRNMMMPLIITCQCTPMDHAMTPPACPGPAGRPGEDPAQPMHLLRRPVPGPEDQVGIILRSIDCHIHTSIY
jgi:hypothetical protein